MIGLEFYKHKLLEKKDKSSNPCLNNTVPQNENLCSKMSLIQPSANCLKAYFLSFKGEEQKPGPAKKPEELKLTNGQPPETALRKEVKVKNPRTVMKIKSDGDNVHIDRNGTAYEAGQGPVATASTVSSTTTNTAANTTAVTPTTTFAKEQDARIEIKTFFPFIANADGSPGSTKFNKYVSTLTRPDNIKNIPNSAHVDHYTMLTANILTDKHALLTYNEGTDVESIAANFATKVNLGVFNLLGFSKENTEVKVVDSQEMIVDGTTSPVELFKDLITFKTNFSSEDNHGGPEWKPGDKKSKKQAPQKKKTVVFLRDFHNMLGTLSKDYKDILWMNSKKFREAGVYLVGLMPNDCYQDNLKKKDAPDKNKLQYQWMDAFKRVDIPGISAEEIAKILKAHPEKLAENFADIGIKTSFAPDAIDTAANLAQSPAGTLDLMRKSIYVKLDESRDENYILKTGLQLTSEDIDKVYKKYPQLKELSQSASGAFKCLKRPETRFDNVGGMKRAKEKIIKTLLNPLKTADTSKESRDKIMQGYLFYGPPGNGKTYLAEAIAGEAGVPFISCSGSDFVERYVGVGAARVRELFDFARSEARKNPKKTAILFIDEIDALGKKRGMSNNDERDTTLNQLLTEMQGLNNHEIAKELGVSHHTVSAYFVNRFKPK